MPRDLRRLSAEQRRTFEREKKRRARARRCAAGLRFDGKPLAHPDWARATRVGLGSEHPTGCQCYDCLWGAFDKREDVPRIQHHDRTHEA